MPQTIAAADLIRRAMLLISAVAAGEDPADGEMNDALLTLNEMIDSWDTQSLAVYGSPNESWVLTPGIATYDWGTTAGAGNFTSERPVFLNGVTCIRNGISTDVEVITQEEYDSIGLKSLSQGIIEKVLYVNAFPLGKITCFPVPSEAVTLSMNVARQLPGPVTLADTIALPPGYLRALRYNLAVDLWPEFSNASTDINMIRTIARESLGKIKVANSNIVPATFENIPGVDIARSWDWRS